METEMVFLDIGSHKVTAAVLDNGYATTSFSSLVSRSVLQQPTMVGHTAHDFTRKIFSKDDMLELATQFEFLEVIHNQHQVEPLEGLEQIGHRAFFREMRLDPQDCVLVYAEHSLLSDERKVQNADMFFGTFLLNTLIPVNSLYLQLLGVGKTQGYIINMGHYQTTMAYFEGDNYRHGIMKCYQAINVGGYNITEFMRIVSLENGLMIHTRNVLDLRADLKKDCLRFAVDYEEERRMIKSSSKKTFLNIGNGTQYLSLGTEVIDAPEMYFKPKEIIGVNERSLLEMILDCIKENGDMESKDPLEIGISGGGMRIPGLKERLTKDLSVKVPNRCIAITCDDTLDSFMGAQYFRRLPQEIIAEFSYTNEQYCKFGASIRTDQQLKRFEINN